MSFNTSQEGRLSFVQANLDMLDGAAAPELKEAFIQLNKNSINHIALDLSNVKYADSSGLSAILIGHRLCRDNGGQFFLYGLKPAVSKIIAIAQLDKVLSIVEDKEAAVTACQF